MLNLCKCSSPRKSIVCEFPLCNCKKCQQLRSEGKPDQDGRRLSTFEEACQPNSEFTKLSDCEKDYLVESKCSKEPNLRESSSSSNMDSMLFDIVGITAFILMATIMFWLMVSKNLWHFAKLAIVSGRRIQLIVSFVLLLLFCGIIFHSIQGNRNRMLHLQQKSLNTQSLSRHNSNFNVNISHQKCPRKKSCTKNLKGSCECLPNSKSPSFGANKPIPSLCEVCANKLKNHSNSNSENTMSDDEIREMYMKFKLYSMPSEMKSPPSPDNLIGLLSSLYSVISGTLANTLS